VKTDICCLQVTCDKNVHNFSPVQSFDRFSPRAHTHNVFFEAGRYVYAPRSSTILRNTRPYVGMHALANTFRVTSGEAVRQTCNAGHSRRQRNAIGGARSSWSTGLCVQECNAGHTSRPQNAVRGANISWGTGFYVHFIMSRHVERCTSDHQRQNVEMGGKKGAQGQG
jgi:hypothetical protein